MTKSTGGQTSLVFSADTAPSFFAYITGLDPGTESVGDLDGSTLATVNYKDMSPEDLADAGKLVITGLVNVDADVPKTKTSGDVTITMPQKTNHATPGTIAGPAYISSVQLGKLEQNQWYQFTATLTWRTGKTVTKPTLV